MNHQQKNRNKKNETITHKPPFRWPWIGPSLNSDPLTGKTRLPHERPLVSSLFVTCPRTVTPTAACFFVTARLPCLASYHAMPSFVVLLFLAESQSLTTTTFLWPPTRWVWKCQQQNKNYLLWTPHYCTAIQEKAPQTQRLSDAITHNFIMTHHHFSLANNWISRRLLCYAISSPTSVARGTTRLGHGECFVCDDDSTSRKFECPFIFLHCLAGTTEQTKEK